MTQLNELHLKAVTIFLSIKNTV